MKLFGTAGIRGISNKDMTPELALHLGRTFGTFLGENKNVLIGMDTRTSSEMLKNSLTSGVLSTGNNAYDAGIVPISLINYCTRQSYDAGIMITSSHNPPEWNGVKFILSTGIEISEKDEEKFEEIFSKKNFKEVTWEKIGEYQKVNLINTYENALLSSVDVEKIKNSGIKIALDLGDGAQSQVIPSLIKKTGCEFRVIHDSLSGIFSRESEPTSSSLTKLRKIITSENYNLGVGFDADGDRAVFLTEKGDVISGDVLGSLISKFLLTEGNGEKIIVTPIATSSLIDEIAKKYNGKVERTKVGSKYVAKFLVEKGLFGFEESDGFIFPKVNLNKDGALVTLKVLELLAKEKKSLSKLVEELPKYYQEKTKVTCPDEKKSSLIENIKKTLTQKYSDLDGLKIFFEDGWVLIRASGTEPIIRIYAESKSKKRARELLEFGVKKVEELIK